MKPAVALLLSLSLLGCFPHNAKHRKYAKVVEGISLASGIGISAFANTGADCDEMAMAGVTTNCRTKAKWLSTAGVALILGGLLGFVATVSTAEEEEETKKVEVQAEKASEKPDLKLPPGVTVPPPAAAPAAEPGQAAGSADTTATPSGSASPNPAAAQQ